MSKKKRPLQQHLGALNMPKGVKRSDSPTVIIPLNSSEHFHIWEDKWTMLPPQIGALRWIRKCEDCKQRMELELVVMKPYSRREGASIASVAIDEVNLGPFEVADGQLYEARVVLDTNINKDLRDAYEEARKSGRIGRVFDIVDDEHGIVIHMDSPRPKPSNKPYNPKFASGHNRNIVPPGMMRFSGPDSGGY